MFTMTRWTPFNSAFQLRREIDDLFNRTFGGYRPEGESATGNSAQATPAWWPGLETYATDGKLGVRVALPGVDPKDVEVSVNDGILTVKGERKGSQEKKDGGYYIRELTHGRFERQLELPEGVEPENVTARFVNGMLEISMPLPVAVVPKRVNIAIEGQGPEKKAVKAA